MSTRVVELFAGIGGFRIAADRLGLRTVFANDIDPWACAVYRNAFGRGPLVEGDIGRLLDRIPSHEVLSAGFPCQPFSFAGKKAGMRDGRASAIEMIAEVLATRRTPVFVLENVKSLLTISRGAHFGTVLSLLTDAGYVVEWHVRNVVEFGLPQNRQRVILVGRRVARANAEIADREGGQTGRIGARRTSFLARGAAWGAHYWTTEASVPSSPASPLASVLEPSVDEIYDFTKSTVARLCQSKKVHQIIDGVEVLWNQEGGRRMGYTVFGTSGAAPTLTCTSSRHYERFYVDGRYRRLTPTEYARLQGFPDNHCDIAPHAVRYALYGNAIAPPLAEWGLSWALSLVASRRRHPAAR